MTTYQVLLLKLAKKLRQVELQAMAKHAKQTGKLLGSASELLQGQLSGRPCSVDAVGKCVDAIELLRHDVTTEVELAMDQFTRTHRAQLDTLASEIVNSL